MTFYDWMMEKYLGEDKAEGDLAQDMKREQGIQMCED